MKTALLIVIPLFAVSLALPVHEDASFKQPSSPELDGHAAAGQFAVDIVYTWVNGSDAKWQAAKSVTEATLASLAAESTPASHHTHHASADANQAVRFADHQELRFSLRSVAAFAPWVRHIYIVVAAPGGDVQRPYWLAEDPKVTLVSHEQICGGHCTMPTYNSFAIESYLDRIPGLAEHFIYLNDDMFFGNVVTEGDFFTASGAPRISFQVGNWAHQRHWASEALSVDDDAYAFATRNDDVCLDKYLRLPLGSVVRKNPLHQAYPLTRQLYKEMRSTFSAAVRETASHQFRDRHDIIPHYLATWLGLYKLQAKQLDQSQYTSAMFVNLADNNNANILELDAVAKRRPTLFCLNDEGIHLDDQMQSLNDFYVKYFPLAPPWERMQA